MYIVRDRASKRVIFVNHSPISQELRGADVYHRFDSETMEVGSGEFASTPEHFNIDQHGWIIPWTPREQIDAGVLKLRPEQKVLGDQIVDKTLAERVADGLVVLKPTEKAVDDRIETKNEAELVAAGIIKLKPTQIVDGQHIREMTEGEKVAAGLIQLEPHQKVSHGIIVPKSRVELAQDGLVSLEPDEKLSGGRIIKLTSRQMLDEKRYDLKRYKEVVLERHAQASGEARRKVLSDDELLYAAIGAVNSERIEECRTIVAPFIKALDETRAAIQKARTADDVEEVPIAY